MHRNRLRNALWILTLCSALSLAPALGAQELASRETSEVIPSGPAGRINDLKSDPTVLRDGDGFEMWYGGNSAGRNQQIFYATSSDGMDWTLAPQPVMSVGAGGAWDAGDVETPTVVKVGSTYHMFYAGREVSGDGPSWSPETAYQLGHATSRDGIRWDRDPANPVITRGRQSHNDWNWAAAVEPTAVWDAATNTFRMWYVGVNVLGGRVHAHVGYATSPDGTTWEQFDGNPVMYSAPTPADVEYNGYFAPFVVKEGGLYTMLFESETWNGQPIGPIRVAHSGDGKTWTLTGQELLSKGATGSWNGSGVFGATLVPDGAIGHLWYTGFEISDRFRFGIGYEQVPFASSGSSGSPGGAAPAAVPAPDAAVETATVQEQVADDVVTEKRPRDGRRRFRRESPLRDARRAWRERARTRSLHVDR